MYSKSVISVNSGFSDNKSQKSTGQNNFDFDEEKTDFTRQIRHDPVIAEFDSLFEGMNDHITELGEQKLMLLNHLTKWSKMKTGFN